MTRGDSSDSPFTAAWKVSPFEKGMPVSETAFATFSPAVAKATVALRVAATLAPPVNGARRVPTASTTGARIFRTVCAMNLSVMALVSRAAL